MTGDTLHDFALAMQQTAPVGVIALLTEAGDLQTIYWGSHIEKIGIAAHVVHQLNTEFDEDDDEEEEEEEPDILQISDTVEYGQYL